MGRVSPMAVGEVRTYMVGERVLTVRRTKRDYIHDLCDALNGSITNRHVEWIVRGNGMALRGARQGGLF